MEHLCSLRPQRNRSVLSALPCSWNRAVEPNDTWPRVAPVISEERAPRVVHCQQQRMIATAEPGFRYSAPPGSRRLQAVRYVIMGRAARLLGIASTRLAMQDVPRHELRRILKNERIALRRALRERA